MSTSPSNGSKGTGPSGGSAGTLENLDNPMAAGCRMAHERGMEFIGVLKPYENGPSHATTRSVMLENGWTGLPGIGGIYRVESWTLARPEMRVRVRQADLPVGLENVPVTRIQLRQKDMASVRIKKENLEIWTSDNNDGYRKRDLEFNLSEGEDTCPHDVVEIDGNLVTSAGDEVRVLDISGLNLLDPFIAVTTNFQDRDGTFANTPVEMVRVFGPDDEPLPIVVASHKAIWRIDRDFRRGDLEYDTGLGSATVRLDVSNSEAAFENWLSRADDAPDGVVAFAKGRNRHLSGSLCEGEAEVRAYWMEWVSDCIAAGVDGVDIRISCHSSWTDSPEIYGFNRPVCEEYERRYGVNPDVEPYDPQLLADLRGDLYDRFVRAARERLTAAGLAFHHHVEIESFRPDAAPSRTRSRPGHINFHWRGWLENGLVDEVTLFGRQWQPERILADEFIRETLDEINVHGVPGHLSLPVGISRQDGDRLADQIEIAYRSNQLAGYTMYESAAMYDRMATDAGGRLEFLPGLTEAVRDRSQELGLV
ncbi:MAG: hypothetical protein OXF76_19885 [Caldilineaceae bacterium]|nr:hypothetical protein [Caldilineaceae bacterium]